MKVHPACALFPDMSADEYDELKADIKANGCHVPVVLYQGAILDGRHRWKVCDELKINCPTVNWKPTGAESIVGHAISLNVHRRTLTPSQKSMIANDALPLYEAEAKARQQSGKTLGQNCPKGKSTEQAGKALGISARYVADAKKLRKEDPKAAARVKSGEQTLAQAKKSSGPPPAKKPKTKPPARRTKLEQAVAAQDPLLRIAGFVIQIRKLVKEIEPKPIGAHFHAQQALTDLKNLERNAKFAMPHALCPMCGGKRGCKLCNKSGFVPKEVFKRWEASQK